VDKRNMNNVTNQNTLLQKKKSDCPIIAESLHLETNVTHENI